MQLAIKENPAVTDVTLTQMLCARVALFDDAVEPVDIEDDVIDDVLKPSDRQAAIAMKKEQKELKKHRKVRASYCRKVVGKIPGIKRCEKSKPSTAKVVKTIERLCKAKGERWWNTVVPEDDTVTLLRPSDCNVHIDLKNGRFRVHHRQLKGSCKSFSWNKVGPETATAKALVQMWAWEQQVSGEACPLPEEVVLLAAS